MCGIALYFDRSPAGISVIKNMTDMVAYRGPDGEGHVNLMDGRLWLGHRRLAIIDVSDAGHQPMSYGDGRYWITFNGEVYNYIELRAELKNKGYRFHSGSDTEVILAAYQEWGEKCLDRFNGMWAFIIADDETGVVFGARDRFGVKPFYYAVDGDRLGCSSEIKQLRAAGFGSGRADRQEVAKFIAYGDVNVERGTFFEGISQLLPGEAFSWNTGEGMDAFRVFRYYRPAANPDMRADGRLAEYQERFNYLLEDAVRLRLRSDVPVGTCLSGGMDSSSIALITQRLLAEQGGKERQKTFTSCFSDPRYDEWGFAEAIVQKTAADSYRVFPDMDSLLDEWPRVAWHQEEPVRSTSIFAQWNVMRLASGQEIKVLLDGQGADEVMAGYHYYIPIYLASLLGKGMITTFTGELSSLNRTGILAVTEPLYRVFLKTAYYLLGLKGLRGQAARALFNSSYQELRRPDIPSDFQRYQYYDIFSSLQSLLRHEDRNSMAFSIEARTPFLDYRMVELFLMMPGEYKINGGWTKPFLRNAMQGVMPENVRLRVDKKGFVTPEAVWARKNIGQIGEILLQDDSPLEIWVDKQKLRNFVWHNEDAFDYQTLWKLLSVHHWMRVFSLR